MPANRAEAEEHGAAPSRPGTPGSEPRRRLPQPRQGGTGVSSPAARRRGPALPRAGGAGIVPDEPASREAPVLITQLAASPFALLVGALAVAVAALVKGTLGVGFPILATPVLALLVDPQTTVIAVSVPAFLMNLFQLKGDEPPRVVLTRHSRFAVAAFVSTPLGAFLLKVLDPASLRLGVGLVVLAWLGLTSARVSVTLPPARERWAAPAMGTVNGLIGGATGIFFPLLAIYLDALGVEKHRFVQTISLLFTVQQVIQLAAAAAIGIITPARLAYALAVCIPVAVGFGIGLWIQGRIDQERFRRLIRWFLIITAVQLIYRGLTG